MRIVLDELKYLSSKYCRGVFLLAVFVAMKEKYGGVLRGSLNASLEALGDMNIKHHCFALSRATREPQRAGLRCDPCEILEIMENPLAGTWYAISFLDRQIAATYIGIGKRQTRHEASMTVASIEVDVL
jgi:hypothetical protein